MENYFLAKAKLFANLDKEAKAVINLDDPYGKKLLKMTKAQIIRVSLKRKNADIFADNIDLSTEGLRFLLKTPSGSIEIKSSLVGLHNVYNIMIAAGLALSEKIEMKIIQQGIAALEKVPGRLEAVNFGQPFKVFVDYAHTPDALKNILEFLRKLAPKRMIAVFGCGGDRDRGKRPLMAKVAAQFCDAIVITSDNPRSEDPEKIAQEITRGIPKDFSHYKVILDRRQAIAEAINSAEPNDIVVIAGKGHERFQIFKDSRIPFDDIEVARDLINQEKICLNSAK
jgi:UDP-N-acetylmuramyl-tripeptide synthetase